MDRYKCIKLVEKDVNEVMRYATAIIVIAPNNKDFKLIQNPYPRLGILAVIGPTDSSDQKFRPKEISKLNFNKALLMEIGLGPSRPYHQAKGINKKKHQSYIIKRRKWFSLTEQQYELIIPCLLDFIIEKSLERIKGWVLTGYQYFTVIKVKHRYGKTIQYKTRKKYAKGTRFAVSSKDNLFIRDLISISKNNSWDKDQIRGLYCFIEMKLRYFLKNKRKLGFFKKSETAYEIKEEIRKIKPSLRGYILYKISKKLKSPVYNDLVEIFGVREIDHLPRKRKITPSFLKISNDVRIEIAVPPKRVYEITKKRSTRDSITFEIFPHNLLLPEEIVEYCDLPSLKELKYGDEVPF
ncbi:hypothetical protein HQ529_03720 [Candidatus Woesearchaeota archaeon]|nr:hypothetical protein [Candidatus Woesearchaeota archaeon]